MLFDTDTIVAISTPPGRGGIGVVRLSGPQARAISEAVCRLRHPLAPGRVRIAEILDPEGRVLDEAVVTWFAAPHSYTTEDVVEIACHAAPVLLDFVVRAAMAHGARLAEPGEFTQRAFLSGRLDLTQAEAVNHLIAAQTLHQARVAAAQLGGAVSHQIAPVKHRLIQLIATLEAGIDFAEDDLELIPERELLSTIDFIFADLKELAGTSAYGKVLRDGFTLAIVGRPNAGKSSLFNRLLRRDRAIVTALPGTTRDPIMEHLSMGGVPVDLVDTAGLRNAPTGPEGEAETQGILRSRERMAEADYVLLVIDATTLQPQALHPEDRATLESLNGRPHAVVLNKCDLLNEPIPCDQWDSPAIRTCATTGAGLDGLERIILNELTGSAPGADSAIVTTLRQQQAIDEAIAAVDQARQAAKSSLPHEVLLMDLHSALEALDRLTGVTTNDDILGLIFSTFCIGK